MTKPTPHSTRDFIRASTLTATLKKLGCVELPTWQTGLTFWRAPSGKVFTLTDPHWSGTDGVPLYDRDFVLDFRDRLMHLLQGTQPGQDGTQPVFHANRHE